MNISGNVFENNTALSEGGVLKWREIQPIFSNDNAYSNNTAIYGPINAAFPFRIHLQYYTNQNTICLEGMKQCYIQIPNIGSGNIINLKLKFEVKDVYNKTVTSLNDE